MGGGRREPGGNGGQGGSGDVHAPRWMQNKSKKKARFSGKEVALCFEAREDSTAPAGSSKAGEGSEHHDAEGSGVQAATTSRGRAVSTMTLKGPGYKRPLPAGGEQ